MRCYCSLKTKERKLKFKFVQILDVLNTAASEGAGGKGRRERPDPVRRHTAVTCVCAAALAGLDTLARKFRGAQPSLTLFTLLNPMRQRSCRLSGCPVLGIPPFLNLPFLLAPKAAV